MFTGQANGTSGIIYTLGCTEPPAVCTAVDHDPLICIDEKDFLEEEDKSCGFGARLNGAQQACARLTREAQLITPGALDLFAENAKAFAFGASLVNTETNALRDLLSQSRAGAAYLACADKHGIPLLPSGQITSATYDQRAGVILYNPTLQEAPLILAVAAALRRHWQDRQGALISPLAFAPETALLIGRAQQADIAQAVLRVAWELRIAGAGHIWAYVETGTLMDLGQAFAAEAFLDFRGLASGDAALAVFEAWFLSPRCAIFDKVLIHKMLARLSRPSGYLSQGLRVAASDLLAALGRCPVGDNYLAKHVPTILEDPLFTEVRDRANANFLWFVKFENCLRSQGTPALQNAFSHAAKPLGYGEYTKACDIVTFHPKKSDRSQIFDVKGEGEVIYLRRSE